ncbi:hypothetical protein BH24CHL6_BH24CHL6_17090 [soil metagenome]
MRWPLAVVLLTLSLVLAGCEAFLGAPAPRVGEPAPGGRGVVVGHGQIDGAEWLATAERQKDQVCLSIRIAGLENFGGGSCTDTVPGQQSTGWGMSSGTGSPTMLDGFVPENVARVEVHSSEGVLEAPTASLTALGMPGNAFALAFPERAVVRSLTFFDAAGNELERTELGPGPGEPAPLEGDELPSDELVLGAGHISGVDWTGTQVDMKWLVSAYRDGDRICTRWYLGDRSDDHSCRHEDPRDGLPDFMLSLGSPTIIEGLMDEVVVEVSVELVDGTISPPLVSLEPLGFRGSGFALVLLNRPDFIDAQGYDASGRVVRRADPPAIPAPR